jgi:hypothetical protein
MEPARIGCFPLEVRVEDDREEQIETDVRHCSLSPRFSATQQLSDKNLPMFRGRAIGGTPGACAGAIEILSLTRRKPRGGRGMKGKKVLPIGGDGLEPSSNVEAAPFDPAIFSHCARYRSVGDTFVHQIHPE